MMLGGLAVGAIIFDIVFALFYFLRASTTGLVAQAVGAGEVEQQRIVLVRSLMISTVMGVVVILLAPLISSVSLLNENPNPDRAAINEGLKRVLCRCGTYTRFIKAVEKAASRK